MCGAAIVDSVLNEQGLFDLLGILRCFLTVIVWSVSFAQESVPTCSVVSGEFSCF